MRISLIARTAVWASLICALSAGAALAYSIVDVPTSNQAALHEVNVAYYGMDVRDLPVTHKNIYIVYSTVAPSLELEWIHVDINKGAPSQNLVNASYKLVAETGKCPDVVVGVKNMFADDHSPDPDEQKASYYVATAKTLNPPKPGQPWLPVVRVHVNYGTREHRGLFGGLQIAVTPRLGVALMKVTTSPYARTFLGGTTETAVVYSLGKNMPNLKAGTLGHHRWAGIDYSLHY